jgi:hypothetical protein
MILTSRRLIWYETRTTWPLKQLGGQLRLSDVQSIDKGNIFNFAFGGMCIRLRLKNGRLEKLYEGDGGLDEWISSISEAVRRQTGKEN